MAAGEARGWRMAQMTLHPEQPFADGYRVTLLLCMASCYMVFAFDCSLAVPGMRG